MNLWKIINDNLNNKGLKKTNLYQMMQDTFDKTDYEMSGYKAFLKRYDQTKLTAEELFQMAYVLELNLGDMQDVFNTHVNSLLNSKKIMESKLIDSIRQSSKFHHSDDYYELFDFNNIPLGSVIATHYFMNLSSHNDTISLELVNVEQGLMRTLGCIKDASKFIEKKFGDINEFKSMNKSNRLKTVLDRIELEGQMYDTPNFKTKLIINDEIQRILNLEYDDLTFDTNALKWTYNGENLPINIDKYISDHEFYVTAEYTILEKAYKENEYGVFEDLNFSENQVLMICELHSDQVKLLGSLNFVAEDSSISISIFKDEEIINMNINKDIKKSKWHKSILKINAEELKDERSINSSIVNMKKELYDILKKAAVENGLNDLPDTLEEARMLNEGYYEKEIFPIKQVLENAEKIEEGKEKLGKQRSFIDRRIGEMISELGYKPEISNNDNKLLLELNFANINVLVYRGEFEAIEDIPRIEVVSHIKTMNKEPNHDLRTEWGDLLERRECTERISKKYIYDPNEGDSISDFDYNEIPRIAFDFMKQSIIDLNK